MCNAMGHAWSGEYVSLVKIFMNNKEISIDFLLEQRVSETMFYIWDPIGVNLMVSCRNEYEDYVPALTAHLLSGSDETTINQLLLFIMESWIGVELVKNARRKSQHQQTLKTLKDWRDRVCAVYPDEVKKVSDFPFKERFSEQLNWSRQQAKNRKTGI